MCMCNLDKQVTWNRRALSVTLPQSSLVASLPGDGARRRLIVSIGPTIVPLATDVVMVGVLINGAFVPLAAVSQTEPSVVLKYEEFGDTLCEPILVQSTAASGQVTLISMALIAGVN